MTNIDRQKHTHTHTTHTQTTRMWNMISSSATPTVCLEQKSENFHKSQRDIIDAVTISKIIVFEIICDVAYYSAAKFQPSNKATKCGIRRSWKLKVKPNLGCFSNIAITISYISVLFHLDNPKIDRVVAV